MPLPLNRGYISGRGREPWRGNIRQDAEIPALNTYFYRQDLSGGDDVISLDDVTGNKPKTYAPIIDQRALRPGEGDNPLHPRQETTKVSASSQPISEKVLAAIVAEAGGQGLAGMQAVAEVIANRAREWGMTPEQVVMQQGQFAPFSYKTGSASRANMKNPALLADAAKAWSAVAGRAPGLSLTNNALYFAAKGKPTASQPLELVATLGAHRFYAPAGADLRGVELIGPKTPKPVVETLQHMLVTAGFDPGPLDGKFSSQTRRAFEAFQTANKNPLRSASPALDPISENNRLWESYRETKKGAAFSNMSAAPPKTMTEDEYNRLVEQADKVAPQSSAPPPMTGAPDMTRLGATSSGSLAPGVSASDERGSVVLSPKIDLEPTRADVTRGLFAQASANRPIAVNQSAPMPRAMHPPNPTVGTTPPPMTPRRLDPFVPPASYEGEPRSSASTEGIAKAQRELAQRGYYTGTIDGIPGPETQRAALLAMRDGVNIGTLTPEEASMAVTSDFGATPPPMTGAPPPSAKVVQPAAVPPQEASSHWPRTLHDEVSTSQVGRMAVTRDLGRDTMEGMQPKAITMLNAALAAAQEAGLAKVTILGAKDVGPAGHKSHAAGTELDITAYNLDGSLWTPAQRVAVATGAASVGATRFGFYTGGEHNSLHMGIGRPEDAYPGQPMYQNVAWGPKGQTSGIPALSTFHPDERAFVEALRSGNIAAFIGNTPDKIVGLQKSLNALGANIAEDGVLGNQTRNALAANVNRIGSSLEKTTYNLHSAANDRLITGSQPAPRSAAPITHPASTMQRLPGEPMNPPPMSVADRAFIQPSSKAIRPEATGAARPPVSMISSSGTRAPALPAAPVAPPPLMTGTAAHTGKMEDDFLGTPMREPVNPPPAIRIQPKQVATTAISLPPPPQPPSMAIAPTGKPLLQEQVLQAQRAIATPPPQMTLGGGTAPLTDQLKGSADPIDRAYARATATGKFDSAGFWSALDNEPSMHSEVRQAKAARLAAQGTLLGGAGGPPAMTSAPMMRTTPAQVGGNSQAASAPTGGSGRTTPSGVSYPARDAFGNAYGTNAYGTLGRGI